MRFGPPYLQPLGTRVLVRATAAPDRVGRLWIPPQAQGEFQMCQGEIVAVGFEVEDKRLQPGLHIIGKRFGRAPLDESGEEWCIFERDILAIVKV